VSRNVYPDPYRAAFDVREYSFGRAPSGATAGDSHVRAAGDSQGVSVADAPVPVLRKVVVYEVSLRVNLVARQTVTGADVNRLAQLVTENLDQTLNKTSAVIYNGEEIFVRVRWERVGDGGPAHRYVNVWPRVGFDGKARGLHHEHDVSSDLPAGIALHEWVGHPLGWGDRYPDDPDRPPKIRLHRKAPGTGDRQPRRAPTHLDAPNTLMGYSRKGRLFPPTMRDVITLVETIRGGNLVRYEWLDRGWEHFEEVVAPALARYRDVVAGDGWFTAATEQRAEQRQAVADLVSAWQAHVETLQDLKAQLRRHRRELSLVEGQARRSPDLYALQDEADLLGRELVEAQDRLLGARHAGGAGEIVTPDGAGMLRPDGTGGYEVQWPAAKPPSGELLDRLANALHTPVLLRIAPFIRGDGVDAAWRPIAGSVRHLPDGAPPPRVLELRPDWLRPGSAFTAMAGGPEVFTTATGTAQVQVVASGLQVTFPGAAHPSYDPGRAAIDPGGPLIHIPSLNQLTPEQDQEIHELLEALAHDLRDHAKLVDKDTYFWATEWLDPEESDEASDQGISPTDPSGLP
jgi:hypothetical protein